MSKPFRSIPGPWGLPLIGSVLDYTSLGSFSYDLIHLAKLQNYQKYGSIYKEKLGVNIVELFDSKDAELVYRNEGELPRRPPLPLCYAAHKRDNIKLGFGNLNGEPWWRYRKAILPVMLKPDAALPYLHDQVQVAEDLVKLIDKKRQHGQSATFANLLELLKKFAIEAYGSICFNVRIGCLEPEVTPDAHLIMTSSAAMFETVQKTTFSFPTYSFFRTAAYREFIEASSTCHSFKSRENEEGFLSAGEKVGLSIDLFTAGIEATAFALAFLLYNLAKNPEKQQKLIAEIHRIVPSGQEISHEKIILLNYLRACIKESFRLNFPVQGGPIRELEKDLVLSGYEVPRKTLVSMNFQTMCVSEEYFSNPLSFVPERWLKHHDVSLQDDLHTFSTVQSCPSSDQHNNRHKAAFAFMPFGYGKRMCIGRRFAEQQMILALIKILQNYRLETSAQNVGMVNRIFTMPDQDIRMTFSAIKT